MFDLGACKVSGLLAYAASVYILACIYYMIVTQSFGTPFKNAIKNYPKLMRIKKESARRRGHAFLMGLVISASIMLIWRPFKKCN